ncbi:MAG: hypothetical protein IT281_06345 [Ignavibacteria bacterium]|nr:hypothetical protein [Ignavibacteria bacterium]
MNKTKNKIDLSSIAVLKSGVNLSYNGPKKLHHTVLDEQDTKVNEKVPLSLTNQT